MWYHIVIRTAKFILNRGIFRALSLNYLNFPHLKAESYYFNSSRGFYLVQLIAPKMHLLRFKYIAIYAVIVHVMPEGTWTSHLRLPFLVGLVGPTTMVGFLCLNFTSILELVWGSRSSLLMVSSSSPISCSHSQALDEQLRGRIFFLRFFSKV